MVLDDFAVFILTHGRPNNVVTYRTLERLGYTGTVYIIVDNEDQTVDEYRKNFGDKVIVFDKAAVAQTFDEAGNFQDRRAVVYARNASFQIARDLGLKYFLQLDDDYQEFRYNFDSQLRYSSKQCLNLDRLFETVLCFYREIPALTITFSQGGDFPGGKDAYSASKVWLKRKAMNSFFCSVDRPFSFLGRINEDVSAYTHTANQGGLFLSVMQVLLNQRDTQANPGGMTELYADSGTYIKSFYTVMFQPSSVAITAMGSLRPRLHHKINYTKTVPCILRQDYQKSL